MAYLIPYESGTYRPDNDLIPGNSESDNPVEFDLVPAGGSDLARLKSILVASAGLTNEGVWSPEMQQAVMAAFDTGSGMFDRCISAIRGYSVPAALALRVGLIASLPVTADDAGAVRRDPKAPIPVTTGPEFAKIAGFQTALALMVAFEIMKLSRQQAKLDPRLFVRPSGSRSVGTSGSPTGTVPTAQKRSGRRGTAA